MSVTEIFARAGLNTLLGMGTVFIMLIAISGLFSLFRYIPRAETKAGDEEASPGAAGSADVQQENDRTLIAVITAALAASEGQTACDVEECPYIVRSVKKIRE